MVQSFHRTCLNFHVSKNCPNKLLRPKAYDSKIADSFSPAFSIHSHLPHIHTHYTSATSLPAIEHHKVYTLPAYTHSSRVPKKKSSIPCIRENNVIRVVFQKQMAKILQDAEAWIDNQMEELLERYNCQGSSNTFDMGQVRQAFNEIIPYEDPFFSHVFSVTARRVINLDRENNRPCYPVGQFPPPAGAPIQFTVPHVLPEQEHFNDRIQFQDQNGFQQHQINQNQQQNQYQQQYQQPQYQQHNQHQQYQQQQEAFQNINQVPRAQHFQQHQNFDIRHQDFIQPRQVHLQQRHRVEENLPIFHWKKGHRKKHKKKSRSIVIHQFLIAILIHLKVLKVILTNHSPFKKQIKSQTDNYQKKQRRFKRQSIDTGKKVWKLQKSCLED